MIIKGWTIWHLIWNTAEALHICLGRFGPFVFHKMIGRKGVKVDE